MAPSQKIMLFVCLLVAAVVVVVPVAEGTFFPLNPVTITGTVFCSVNGSNTTTTVGNVSTSTPPFANAAVQLRCGAINSFVIASTITNANGMFTLQLNIIETQIAQILSNCRVVIATPLSACNATLPATGNLVSSLQLIPGVFQYNIAGYTLVTGRV